MDTVSPVYVNAAPRWRHAILDQLLANPDAVPPGNGEPYGRFVGRTHAAIADALKRVAISGESEALALHARDFYALGIPEPEPGSVFTITP